MPVRQHHDRLYDGDPQRLARWRPQENSPPSIAVWEITLRCDLGCRHCGSRAGRARHDELSTAEALDLVHQLADLGVREVTLIGGEFYLRDDWDQIAAEIARRGMLCSIVTGARQMTDERIRRAAAAGVGKISLSIDGLERTHDEIRGSAGSWRAAVSAARRISASGIDLAVNTQMNRLTMPELPGVADLLVDIGARSWMVILTAAMGRAADRPKLMLQPYHFSPAGRHQERAARPEWHRLLSGEQRRLLRAAGRNAAVWRRPWPPLVRLRGRCVVARN